MLHTNIALLRESQRYEIELSKRAALLIYELRYNKIHRGDIQREILAEPEATREHFKSELNRYREM